MAGESGLHTACWSGTLTRAGNEITFPIGLNISRVTKIGPLPVKLQDQGQYMPVHPDIFGQKWNLQFAVTPVIPKLIKGEVLEGW
jgi:hypothetical protein